MSRIPTASRREFLLGSLGLMSVAGAVPHFLARTALAGPPPRPDDAVLVVVQLSGGNDGLSTVVPYAHDNYHRVRNASRIPANAVLKLDTEVGLHPNLTGFKGFYDEGQLAVLQGVGYPNFNQSHFTSMDIWHVGDPSIQEAGSPRRESGMLGWLGRYCDQAFPGDVDLKRAIAVGFAQAPRAIQGRRHPGLSFQGVGGFRFFVGDPRDKLRTDLSNRLARLQPGSAANPNAELDFVSQTISGAIAVGEEVSNLAMRYRSRVMYPFSTPLGFSLRTVAAMITGGLSTRVYYVFQDGYDTHADQKPRHDKLMADLNAAIAAFYKDLAQQGHARRVLIMTMSEFGRRVHENGSRGTDHGMAAPMFLIGPGVKGGVHGRHPGLDNAQLVMGRDVQYHTDFRSVYATVLEKWLHTPSQPVLGTRMPLVDCLG